MPRGASVSGVTTPPGFMPWHQPGKTKSDCAATGMFRRQLLELTAGHDPGMAIAPELERYGPGFDAHTGNGGLRR